MSCIIHGIENNQIVTLLYGLDCNASMLILLCCVDMEVPMCGRPSLIYLTSFLLLHWLVQFSKTSCITALKVSRTLPHNWFYSYIFYFSRLSQKFFAFMVDCRHPLKLLIISVISIVFKKFLMKDLCVTFYGLILMIDVVGVSLLGVLDIRLAK